LLRRLTARASALAQADLDLQETREPRICLHALRWVEPSEHVIDLLDGLIRKLGGLKSMQERDELRLASREAIEDWLAMARQEWVSPL
jgi:hypothetical protein